MRVDSVLLQELSSIVVSARGLVCNFKQGMACDVNAAVVLGIIRLLCAQIPRRSLAGSSNYEDE